MYFQPQNLTAPASQQQSQQPQATGMSQFGSATAQQGAAPNPQQQFPTGMGPTFPVQFKPQQPPMTTMMGQQQQPPNLGQPAQIGGSQTGPSLSSGGLQVQTAYSQPSSATGGPPSGGPPHKFSSSSATNVQPLEKRITPNGLPPQMLTGYGEQSVETLCTLGKELVLELMTRIFSIINMLKLNIKGDNKPNKPTLPGVDNVDTVRLQLEYSRLIFMALTEIRLRIDLKLSSELASGQTLMGAQPSHSVLIKMLSDPTPPKEDTQKAELAQQFEGNRQKLIQLSCQLKKLEWLAMNSADSSGSAGGGKRRSAEESGNSSRRS